jgi:hypothetical protein
MKIVLATTNLAYHSIERKINKKEIPPLKV